MIHSISYDVIQGDNYDGLYKIIKTADSWAHVMDSLWFISTTESVDTWSNRLRQVLDQNDWLFVVDITGQPQQGWVKKGIADWLHTHEQSKSYTY